MAKQRSTNGRGDSKSGAVEAPAKAAAGGYEMNAEQHAVWRALHQEVSAMALEHSRAVRAAEEAAERARAAEGESAKAAARAAELAKAVAHAEARHHQRTLAIIKEMGCPVAGGGTVDVDAETGRVTVKPPPARALPRALASN